MRISVQITFDKTMDTETHKSDITIGRSTTNDIVIAHDSVSRNHCRVELVKGVFYITDLGSSNGTKVDGVKLEPEKRTPFLSTSQVVIGKLDCEFSASGLQDDQISKAQELKTNIMKNATTTMRIGRLDLNKPSKTLEMEKKNKIKGPRNPITDGIEAPADTKYVTPVRKYLILLILVSLINWYLIDLAIR